MSEIIRQHVNFRFFRTLPEWRRLSDAEKNKGKKEFEAIVKKYQSKMIILSYSLVGLRAEADFMLWRISEQLEDFNEMSAELLKTGLGKYIQIPYSYLAVTKRSMYVDKHQHEGSEASRAKVVPGNAKYLFVYPFIKQREWYLLSKEERQKTMDVHIALGHKYPSVKINTTYSFGIDDQEFVVAFEADSAADFVDLVMDLRETQASKYTVRDTPAFTCIKKSIEEVLNDIG
ncbi:MAG: chlorite dismutase [Gammaproteobacteria bacterium RIFCSPHIGHO2_02_FULL_42_13]|nr:MAG: chlorite dismutase [Gammaproteobacteria bacterium RIFCSPHIGHO2_02_FULL_42_13]